MDAATVKMAEAEAKAAAAAAVAEGTWTASEMPRATKEAETQMLPESTTGGSSLEGAIQELELNIPVEMKALSILSETRGQSEAINREIAALRKTLVDLSSDYQTPTGEMNSFQFRQGSGGRPTVTSTPKVVQAAGPARPTERSPVSASDTEDSPKTRDRKKKKKKKKRERERRHELATERKDRRRADLLMVT